MDTTYDEIFSLLKRYNLSIDDLKDYQEEQEKNKKAREIAVKATREKLVEAAGAYGDALDEAYEFSNWDKTNFIKSLSSWLKDLEASVAADKDTVISMKIGTNETVSSKPNNSKKSAGSGDSKQRDPDTVLREYLKQMGF